MSAKHRFGTIFEIGDCLVSEEYLDGKKCLLGQRLALGLAHIIGEGVRLFVLRIGGEGFARGQLPLFGIEGGEIGIHVFGSGIYLGQRKAVGQWQRIAIDAVTADDEHLFICTAGRECCLQRWEHFRTIYDTEAPVGEVWRGGCHAD